MRLTAVSAALVSTLLLVTPTSAQNTVDPNGTGATDVFVGSTRLNNPVSPLLELINSNLTVGDTASGEIRIAGGASIAGAIETIIGNDTGGVGTVTVDGAGSDLSIANELRIGNEGIGMLIVENGGLTQSAGDTFLARNGGSTGQATIRGTDSSLIVGQALHVGTQGAGTLTVESGSSVMSANGLIGSGGTGSGAATVTGTGSVWTNTGNLTVAPVATTDGSSRLDILDGGTVSNAFAIVADAADSVGSVTVAGAESTWTSSGSLRVGRSGLGTLTVADGGTVTNTVGWLGIGNGSNGTATVTGAGSNWANGSTLNVGALGSGVLTIENGGAVSNTSAILGRDASGSGDVTVDGADSTWTSSGFLSVGEFGLGNLSITNGGVVTLPDTTTPDDVFIGRNSGGVGVITVSGSDSTLDGGDDLFIGLSGRGDITVENGGFVTSRAATLARNAGSIGIAIVDGPTSSLELTDSLFVGRGGSGTLVVQNGGFVRSETASIALEAGSDGLALIDGADSTWTNTGPLAIGGGSAAIPGSGGRGGTATLFLNDGGQLSTVGSLKIWDGSSVIVDGTLNLQGLGVPSGDTINDSGSFAVGESGIGLARLTDGAVLFSNRGVVGNQAGSNGTVTVEGAETVWQDELLIQVGNEGTGSLQVTGGATVETPNGDIGFEAGSTGTVTVSGSESTWTQSDRLIIGSRGNGTLRVEEGGTVAINGAGRIANGADSVGLVEVRGTGSLWDVDNTLYVGREGTGTLVIEDGGRTQGVTTIVGDEPAASGSIVVAGNGSILETEALAVGGAGSGSLFVHEGAAVSSTAGGVAFGSGSSGTVEVHGAGSTWSVAEGLMIGGLNGSTATLDVRNRGTVTSSEGVIGIDSNAAASAQISGVGSNWTVANRLTVASSGAGSLQVANGSSVTSGDATIAGAVGSDGTVEVTGVGSTWNAGSELVVGDQGVGVLNVAAGGSIVATGTASLANAANSSGTVNVTGVGSTLNVAQQLTVGGLADGRLAVTDQGSVITGTTVIESGSVDVSLRGQLTSNLLRLDGGMLKVGSSGTVNSDLAIVDGGIIQLGDEGPNPTINPDSLPANPGHLRVNTELTIGDEGIGSVRLTNLSTLVAETVSIGRQSGSSGTLTLENAAPVTVGSITLGGTANAIGGFAELVVRDGLGESQGGFLSPFAEPALRVADSIQSFSGVSTVRIKAGRLSTRSLRLVQGDTLSIQSGRLTIDGGELVLGTDDYILGNLASAAESLAVGQKAEIILDKGATWEISTIKLTNGTADSESSSIGVLGGSRLTVTDDLVVGGLLTNASTATFPLSSGRLIVGGMDTQATAKRLFVGAAPRDGLTPQSAVEAQGAVEVTDGAELRVSERLEVGSAATPGFLRVVGQGAALTYLGEPDEFGFPNQPYIDHGTVTVADGGVITLPETVVLQFANRFESSAASSNRLMLRDGLIDGWVNLGAAMLEGYGQVAGEVFDGVPVVFGNGDFDVLPGTGGSIVATGGLVIGDSTSNDGVAMGGTIRIPSSGTLVLEDANQARLGSQTTLEGGALVARNGFELGNRDRLSGFGILVGEVTGPGRNDLDQPTDVVNFEGALQVGDLFAQIKTLGTPKIDGFISIDGGRLESDTGRMTLGERGIIVGTGTVSGEVSAALGSEIDVDPFVGQTLAIGDDQSASGFYSNGRLTVRKGGRLDLLDANGAVLDSGVLVTLGRDGAFGTTGTSTLSSTSGLTLDFGGNMQGTGTIETPNDAATPFINNGHLTGDSLASPITLTGYVKGVGTLDNVVITGTDAPGFSPATVNRGSVAYNGTLEIELGGTASGQYDRINHLLGDGNAALGGELVVSLIDGYEPAAGDVFDFLTATGDLTGVFATENLPEFANGLYFDVLYGPNAVGLAVAGVEGDYNFDGIVDAADYTVWRDNLGTTYVEADYDVWVSNFGSTAFVPSLPVPNATSVPEPTSVMLLSACILLRRRRR